MAVNPFSLFTAAVLGFSLALAVGSTDAAEEHMRNSITNHKVQVFSKSYCPYCKSTKKLFDDMKVEYHVDELDQMGADGASIQDALAAITGQRTVPNVFIGGKHVGGNSDLVSAKQDGSLVAMLREAKVNIPAEL